MSEPCAYPCIDALHRAALGDRSGDDCDSLARAHAPLRQHPVLDDQVTRDLLLSYQQQRAAVRRALEECYRHREGIPPRLAGPLQQLMADVRLDLTHTSGVEAAAAADGESRPAPGQLLRHHKSMELSHMIAQCGAQYVSKDAVARAAASISASDTDSKTTMSDRDHSAVATTAVLHAKYGPPATAGSSAARRGALGSSTGPTPKEMLQQAFECRRNNDRRGELRVLLEYLRLGHEGAVSLDTSTTTRLLRQIGEAHVALQEHVSAEQYFFDWYLICEKIGDWGDSARALLSLGNACHARGDLDAAHQWLSQAKQRIAKSELGQ